MFYSWFDDYDAGPDYPSVCPLKNEMKFDPGERYCIFDQLALNEFN